MHYTVIVIPHSKTGDYVCWVFLEIAFFPFGKNREVTLYLLSYNITLYFTAVIVDCLVLLPCNQPRCGFCGLVVSMLPSGTQDRGFKPGRSRRIFFCRKKPKHDFLRKGSKTVGGTLKISYDYVEVDSIRRNSVGQFSPEAFLHR
jgi:hypothetical protein